MIDARKAEELEIVELKEDLPKYGLKRGERGVVITAFDQPDEAYDLEFVDESGTSSRFAYSVLPDQIINIDAIAKENVQHAIELFNTGSHFEAELEFRRVLDLKPSYLGTLHNSIIDRFADAGDWLRAILWLRLLVRLDPSYEAARGDLAVAYVNYGVQKATQGELEAAIRIFDLAIVMAPTAEVEREVKANLAAAYTSLGIRAQQNDDDRESLSLMRVACEISPNEITRYNLAVAFANSASCRLAAGEYLAAVHDFEHAEDAGFLSAEMINNYGVALANVGELARARQAFERALSIFAEDVVAESNLELVRRIEAGAVSPQGLGVEQIKSEFTPGERLRSQVQAPSIF